MPETNGRVGMIGSSYDGFTALMGLINPHPALKAAVPQSPMVDGWMGDDWFHYGAFRQTNIDYFTGQMTRPRRGRRDPARGPRRLRRTSCAPARPGTSRRAAGLDQIPFYRKVTEHPAYDEFWSEQALDKELAAPAAEGADHVVRGAVGPGGHVGRHPRLCGDRAEGRGQRHELPGAWARGGIPA